MNLPLSRQAGLPRAAMLPMLIALALSARAGASTLATGAGTAAASGNVSFDADFFPRGSAAAVDLARFGRSGYVAPGIYRGDVVMNQQWRARTDIVYIDAPDQDDPQPCFTAEALRRYGVDLDHLQDDPVDTPRKTIPAGSFCGPLGDYIPGAMATFDAGNQVLRLSVPQIHTLRHARGQVDVSQWDAGIPAAVLGYTTNLYRSAGNGTGQLSGYLGLNGSLHVRGWQFRHQGALGWSEHGHARYRSSAAYLQHDVPAWQAQLVVGDTFTSGELFDSVRMRGAGLSSDDRMLPQSLRGFAPVVRGIADTNARVVIRQRGAVVHETSVAAGPFAIDDLYPTGYGGDLDVEITEADGRVKRYSVPFSAVTQLLRPGQNRWSITAGRVADPDRRDPPDILQATYQRGLGNALTGYTGAIAGSGYQAVLAGAALNTRSGAYAFDLTRASTHIGTEPARHGASMRLSYNKNFVGTGTDLAMAAYRYSTSGFVSLQDVSSMRDAQARGEGSAIVSRQRNRMDISINQSLGARAGQLYLIGSQRSFWGDAGRQLDFTAGYSNQWGAVSYGLSVQRTRESLAPWQAGGLRDSIPGAVQATAPALRTERSDTRLYFTLSVPLGRAPRAPALTALVNRSQQGGSTTRLAVSGTGGSEDRLSWGAGLSRAASATALDLHGQYAGQHGQLTANASRGPGYRQFGAGMSGGMVLHAGGLTLSPPLGDTVGLVHAPGAAGARVENGQGTRIDARGYAIVPYLIPYQLNDIALDPRGAGMGVTFKETNRRVVPRAGAVVRLDYDSSAGRAVIIETTLTDGRAIPFGADVLDAQGQVVGVAGQGSRLFLNGLQHSGDISVRWGDGLQDRCQVRVTLHKHPAPPRGGYETLQAVCEQQPAPTTAAHPTQRPPSSSSSARLQDTGAP